MVILVLIIILYYRQRPKEEPAKSADDGSKVSTTTTTTIQASGETGNADETEFEGIRLLSEDEIDETNSGIATEKLMAVTPFYSADFAVEYVDSEGTFNIILFAILNRGSQLEQYNADLRKFKYEALEWIAQQGVNIYDINIRYLPEEAKDL
jgi:hypothetical protein